MKHVTGQSNSFMIQVAKDVVNLTTVAMARRKFREFYPLYEVGFYLCASS